MSDLLELFLLTVAVALPFVGWQIWKITDTNTAKHERSRKRRGL